MAQADSPSSTPATTPVPAPTPTPTAEPAIQIPGGWKRVEDDRLGYSLAVPFTWLTFDLHSGAVGPIAGLLGGDMAVEILSEFLDTPEGNSFGILAIEPDPRQLFANPPFPMFLNVSVVPLSEDITAQQLVSFLQDSAEELNEVELLSLLTGSLNGLPALQAAVIADLRGLGYDISPYIVITVLRTKETAYILTIAARAQSAANKQPLIEQIVATFRPDVQTNTQTVATTPTAMPTTASESVGAIYPGRHLVGIDIEPGIYVGLAEQGSICTWQRLNSLKEVSESISAVDVQAGLFYVEVLASDLGFTTDCELMPIESVPARAELLKTVPAGMYLVGRDIATGLYKGEASAGSTCTWKRLNGLTGDFASVTSTGTRTGQYFVVVIASDEAVEFSCPVEKVE